VDRYDSMLG